MADEPKKRRIYVVGGKGKNIPPWVTAAFDVEQFDQEHTRGREPSADQRPDAIVVLTSWVGHKHFYDGRELAAKLSIPLILSPGGWSASLKSAADLGAEWFIKDIESAKKSDSLSEKEVSDLSDFIDNAWREAYSREWAARSALEKRHEILRKQLEDAKSQLASAATSRESADRVLREIRAAAAQQREALEIAQAETGRMAEVIRAKSDRLSAALATQLDYLAAVNDQLSSAANSLQTSAHHLSGLNDLFNQGMKELRAAIAAASDEESAQLTGPSNSIEQA